MHTDRGFTLVEAVVALVIIFGLMLVLLRTFDLSAKVLAESRRQAAASAFATELIERAQALEWKHMGLATSTKGNDCLNEEVGCYIGNPFSPADLTYDAGTDTYAFGGEDIVFANADTFRPFLNFHELVARGDTDFDRYLFVTSMVNPVTLEETARRLTAVVQWMPPNGFRQEVRAETIVSEYREPAQPLIAGSAQYTGGSVEILEGSRAYGTEWQYAPNLLNPLLDDRVPNERLPFKAFVELPVVELDAVSDFVSGTLLRVDGSALTSVEWDGGGSASVAPFTKTLLSDDDASSLPPLNPGILPNESVTGFHYRGAAMEDFIAAELLAGRGIIDASTDPAIKDWIDPVVYDVELWTQLLDGGIDEDELPYVELVTDPAQGAPDKIVAGFVEYEAGSPAAALYSLSGPGLERTYYEFNLFRRGSVGVADSFYLDAVVDRINDDVTGERSVESEMLYRGDVFYLLDDDAYRGAGNGKSSRFRGWVRITMPEIRIDDVEAGEGVLASPDLVTSGDILVDVWDPSILDYAIEASVDFAAMGADCDDPTPPAASLPVTVPLWGGAGISDSLLSNKNPLLDYFVAGEITVRGWCQQIQTDTLGNVSQVLVQSVGPILSGDLVYHVEDRLWQTDPVLSTQIGDWGAVVPGIEPLFDVALHFDIDSLAVTSVYLDPAAG